MLPKTGDFRIAPTGGALEGGRRRRGRERRRREGGVFQKEKEDTTERKKVCRGELAGRVHGRMCIHSRRAATGALKTRPSHPTITKTQVKKRKGLFKTQKKSFIGHLCDAGLCGTVRRGVVRCVRVCVRA